MDRDIPAFNRSVMERIYSKNHELHLKRLHNIKSGVSSHKSYSKPASSNLTNSNSIVGANYHSKLPQYHNPKRQSIQQVNNTNIERENALLFKKMIKIMKRPDRNNDPTAPRYNKTMNAAKQRMSMEFSRINEENKTLFNRLQQQKPTIDMKKLEQQRLKNLQILKFLGKYPNQEAMLRASQQQFNTFDLKSRKMNSTSNRIYYNNLPRETSDGEGLAPEERFRNDMEVYDRELRELRDETKRAADKNSRTIEKFTSTSGNYYNPRRATHGKGVDGVNYETGNEAKAYHHFRDQYANKQMVQIADSRGKPGTSYTKNQINEPLPPARRKFLSQGGQRHTAYDSHSSQRAYFGEANIQAKLDGDNYYEEVNEAEEGEEMQGMQKYPYHLNHPSNNIVIQDRLQNFHASNNAKRRTLQNARENKGIANNLYGVNVNTHGNILPQNAHNKHPTYEPTKPNIPKPYLAPKNISQDNMQRKLNKKNSQSRLQASSHEQPQPSIKPQFNMFQQQFYHESMQEQDEQYYETEASPQRISKKNVQSQNQFINTKDEENLGYHQLNRRKEENMILLYKTSVQLGLLIVKQQMREIIKDILQFINKGNAHNKMSGQNAKHQLKKIELALKHNLQQQLREISIYRLSQSYIVTISSHNPQLTNNAKKKRYQEHSARKSQTQYQNQTYDGKYQEIEPSILHSVKQYIENYISQIEEVEIPEEEGSLLLEDIDYNYKQLIQHMVKVEKDVQDTTNQHVMSNSQPLYRLVIVLNQEGDDTNEKEQQTNIIKTNEQEPQKPVIAQQNSCSKESIPLVQKQFNSSDLAEQKITKDPQNADSDQEQTLIKPQAVSANIFIETQPIKHETSVYVQALDQQVQ